MKKLFLFAQLILFAIGVSQSSVSMAEKINVELEFEPDVNNGRRVYELCASCHLPEGWGNKDGTYPQLAGQHKNVLIKQLVDIRTGKRENPLMYPFVQQRTIGGYQSLVDVVAYISTLPMNPDHAKGPWPPDTAEYAKGRDIYSNECSACHLEQGGGANAGAVPRLHGQHYTYMLRQVDQARKGQRMIDQAMLTIVNALDEKQIQLVMNYISYLDVPAQDQATLTDN